MLLGGLAFAVGLALCAWMVEQVGAGLVREQLRTFAPCLPWLLLLEACRAAAELVGTFCVLGPNAWRGRWRQGLRAQLAACSLSAVMPGGRAVGEGAKAALLAPHVGLGLALTAGAAAQLANLVVNAAWATGGAVVALHRHLGALVSQALCTYALLSGGLAIALMLSLRVDWPRRFMARWAGLHAGLSQMTELWRRPNLAAFGSLAAQFTARSLQALQLMVLLDFAGANTSLSSILLTQSLYLAGASAGELVPGQVGALDAAFAFAAHVMGLSAVSALGLTFTLHIVQLAGAAGFGVASILMSGSRVGDVVLLSVDGPRLQRAPPSVVQESVQVLVEK